MDVARELSAAAAIVTGRSADPGFACARAWRRHRRRAAPVELGARASAGAGERVRCPSPGPAPAARRAPGFRATRRRRRSAGAPRRRCGHRRATAMAAAGSRARAASSRMTRAAGGVRIAVSALDLDAVAGREHHRLLEAGLAQPASTAGHLRLGDEDASRSSSGPLRWSSPAMKSAARPAAGRSRPLAIAARRVLQRPSGTSSCSPESRSRTVAAPRFELVLAEDHGRRARRACWRRCMRLTDCPDSRARRRMPARRRSARQLQRACSASSPIGTIATGRGARRRLLQQHRQPLDAGRPADAGRRRPAHLLDQAVIAPAGQHRALGARARRS